MINISLVDKNLEVTFSNRNYVTFNTIVAILKSHKFRYNPTSKKWVGSSLKYDALLNSFEDLDTINNYVDQSKLEKIVTDINTPEQEIEKVRRIPDFSLLNYPPMKGKYPHEDFQKEGITKGINRSRYAYLYQQGLGKSYIAAAIIAHRLYKYHDAGKVLFVTTAVGVRNLKHELVKFIKGLKEEDILIGNKDLRNVFDEEYSDKNIVLCSYNSFRLICEYYKKKQKITSKNPRNPFLPLKEWLNGSEGILILDESHEAANTTSQRGRLLALHSPTFKYRYLFTGTFADVPEKSYNQMKILDPWLVYNMPDHEWKSKMAVMGTRFSPYAVRYWKHEELEESNKRFLKAHGESLEAADAIELPDFFEIPIYVDMGDLHRKIYEQVTKEDLTKTISKDKVSTRDMVNRFQYLLLAVDNPYLLEKHEENLSDEVMRYIKNFKPYHMEKLNALDDIVDSHQGEDILVWINHPRTAEMVAKRYPELNPVVICGEVPDAERGPLIDSFKNDKKVKMLIANIATMNTSVTLTNVTTQVYVELTFNYTQFAQSERRCYRIGQTKPVTTYILLYNKSLNVFQWKSLGDKGMLTKGLVSKEFISQEEWEQIYNCSEDTNFGKY